MIVVLGFFVIVSLALTLTAAETMKNILITGANSGIGYALTKRLILEKGCFVYMGSRSVERGEAAVKKLISDHPDTNGKVEMINIDVTSQPSITSAAEELKKKGIVLAAVVNNAGVGLAHEGVGPADVLDTNYHGVYRVSETMKGLLHPTEGRIVNVSSGAASAYVKTQTEDLKKFFSNPDLKKDELDACIQTQIDAGNVGWAGGYGLSKAALSALTLVQAKEYAPIKVVSLSPGFIDTAMTKGFGAKLSPEEGCRSALKCLFEEVSSGWYYGSDGLRSPLTMTRDPGTPEYQGEADPDPSVYNK